MASIRSGRVFTGTADTPTQYRVALDALGFVWDAGEHEHQRVLTALHEFKAEHGHMRVPGNYTCYLDGDTNFPLGWRVSTIRVGDTFTGTSDNPTPYRVALNTLGFVWDAEEHERQRVLAALHTFKAEHGHMRMPQEYTCFSDGQENFRLGQRVANIRSGHVDTGTAEAPTPYRVALDALGFVWDGDEHERQRMLAALRAFKADHGHMRVPFEYKCVSDGEVGYLLGQRVNSIRTGRTQTGTADAPTPFRTALDQLGFVWDAEEHERQRTVAALRKFKADHGHMRVPQKYTCEFDGDVQFNLGTRVATIRSGHTFTGTSDAPTLVRQELNALGFIWNVPEHERQRVLAALRGFKAKHGHVRVPVAYKCVSDGDSHFQLGKRVRNIRSGHVPTGTTDAPTPYRVALDALGFVW